MWGVLVWSFLWVFGQCCWGGFFGFCVCGVFFILFFPLFFFLLFLFSSTPQHCWAQSLMMWVFKSREGKGSLWYSGPRRELSLFRLTWGHEWGGEKCPSSPEYPSGFCPLPSVADFSLSSRSFLFLGDRGGFPRRRPLEVAPGPALESSVAAAQRPPPDTRPSPAPQGGRSSPGRHYPHGLGRIKCNFVLGRAGIIFHRLNGKEIPSSSYRKMQNASDNKQDTLSEFECDSSSGVLGLI